MESLLRSAPAELLDACLVVEDDSIIRLDLEETLRGFGLKRVHGAGTLDAGTVDTVAAGGCAGSVADGAGTR